MTYVIVGFQVNQKRSVHYATAKTLEKCLEHVKTAFEEKEAEFISLRRVKEEHNG